MAEVPAAELAIIARLERVAQGLKDPYAPFDPVPTQEEQFRAAQELAALRRAQQERANREQDHAVVLARQAEELATIAHTRKMEEARLNLEAEKAKAAADIEYERLSLQKAEVVVKLIEAAKGNAALEAAVQDALGALTGKLLEGTGARRLLVQRDEP